MTTIEFSNAFDTLLNSYSAQFNFGENSSRQDIVLDEYEKSTFLTEAQQQIVVELYTGRNQMGASFEATEELRAYLRSLIKTATLLEQTGVRSNLRTQLFELPPDLLFIVYEEALIQDNSTDCLNGKTIPVIPTTWDSLHKTIHNPFRKPSKRRALRLDSGSSTVEILSEYHIGEYIIKYLVRPTPIILTNLDRITIEGFNTITECELDSVVHEYILERAVQLALKSKGISG